MMELVFRPHLQRWKIIGGADEVPESLKRLFPTYDEAVTALAAEGLVVKEIERGHYAVVDPDEPAVGRAELERLDAEAQAHQDEADRARRRDEVNAAIAQADWVGIRREELIEASATRMMVARLQLSPMADRRTLATHAVQDAVALVDALQARRFPEEAP